MSRHKEGYAIKVTAFHKQGVVLIEQTLGGKANTITVTPEQAQLVCDWIMEMAEDCEHTLAMKLIPEK